VSFDITDYQPRYVPTQEIPVEGPDSYDIEDKRRALFQAESKLDTDINGGEPISEENIHPIHRFAVLNLATYHLVRSAVSPRDTTLGDIANDGDRRETYAKQFLETYNEAVDSLAETDVTDGDDDSGRYYGATGSSDGSGSYSTVVNDRWEDRMEHEYPYSEDERFPDEDQDH